MLEMAQFFTSLAGIAIPLGILLIISGRVKLKNELDVVVRVLGAFCIAMACYWVIGYSLSTVPSQSGLFGTGKWFFDRKTMIDDASNLRIIFLFSLPPIIVATSMAERGAFTSNNILVAATAIFVAPITAHWAWAGLGEYGLDGVAIHVARQHIQQMGWLAERGFVDHGGAVVIFSAAGFAGLAATLTVGPRKGRFPLLSNRPRGHSPSFHFLGTIAVVLGLAMISAGQAGRVDRMDEMVFNVLFGAIFAVIAILMTIGMLRKSGYSANLMNVGVAGVAGAIAMTSFTMDASPASAALAGMFAGGFAISLRYFFTEMEIDDPGDVIAFCLAGGLTGGMIVPIISSGLSPLLLTDLATQTLGLVVISLWSFGSVWVVATVLHITLGLRVTDADEMRGLSRSHFAVQSEPDYLFTQLQRNQSFAAAQGLGKSKDLERLSAAVNERVARLRNEVHRAVDRVQSSGNIKIGGAIASRMRYADDTLRVKAEDVLLLMEQALGSAEGNNSAVTMHEWIVRALDVLMAPSLQDLDQFIRHIPLQADLDELEYLVVAASESLSRCAHQVEQICDFGSAHSEGHFARDRNCDLAALLRDKRDYLLAVAEMRNSPLQIDCPVEKGFEIAGDERALSRILLLMVEAAFNRPDRNRDRPIRLELREQTSNTAILLDCLDTGAALSQRQLAAISDPMSEEINLEAIGFNQIMPLILIQQLVRAIGGEIKLSSEQGLGTRLSCRFRSDQQGRQNRRGDGSAFNKLDIKKRPAA